MSDKRRLFFKPEERQNYNVEIYNGKTLLGVVTVQAGSPEDASNIAVKGINVKIRKAWN
jgi:hypothetical protein